MCCAVAGNGAYSLDIASVEMKRDTEELPIILSELEQNMKAIEDAQYVELCSVSSRFPMHQHLANSS